MQKRVTAPVLTTTADCSAVTLFFALAFSFNLHAGPRTSADYSVIADTADSGGAHTTSTDYSASGSAATITGISTVSSSDEIMKSGFFGQLYDLANGISLNAAQATINERGTLQLGALRLLDDGTGLALDPATVAWSILAGPITSFSNSGLATAGTVYQDSAASVQGVASGFTASLNLTVLNVNNDDLGSYANDGLPDSWQVQYFGMNNPKAAPGYASDGSGLTNLFKYTAGLIPNSAASKFILNLNPVNGQPGQRSIAFNPSLADRIYTVESSTDLIHWSTLSGPFPGNGSTQTVTDTNAGGPQKFYRVQVTKP